MGPKNRKPFANPFGKLKGFSASEAPKESKAPAPPPAEPEEPEDGDLFAGEMARLGVEQGKTAGRPARPAPELPAAESESTATDDTDEFLAALGQMDVRFEDGLPAEQEAAAPRRMKLVRQGKLVPEATLDLHGLDRFRAREKVGFFLENAAWQGQRTVLIITGRGVGSGGEPVLRQIVESFLAREAAAWVSEWGRAPARFGGEGAIVVFLRGRRKEPPAGG